MHLLTYFSAADICSWLQTTSVGGLSSACRAAVNSAGADARSDMSAAPREV